MALYQLLVCPEREPNRTASCAPESGEGGVRACWSTDFLFDEADGGPKRRLNDRLGIGRYSSTAPAEPVSAQSGQPTRPILQSILDRTKQEPPFDTAWDGSRKSSTAVDSRH